MKQIIEFLKKIGMIKSGTTTTKTDASGNTETTQSGNMTDTNL